MQWELLAYRASEYKVFLLQSIPVNRGVGANKKGEPLALSSPATRLAAQAPQARKTIPRPRPDVLAERFAPPYMSTT